MRKSRFALSLMVAMSIAGSAWGYQPSAATPVTGRFTSADSTAKKFTVETSTGDITFKTDARTIFMRLETRVNLSDLKVGDQIRVTYTGDESNRLAAQVETIVIGTTSAKTVTGSVTSVDVSGRRVTIDMAGGSTDLSSINTGDQVRIQLESDSLMADRIDVLPGEAMDAGMVSTNGGEPPKSGSPRRSLGLWLLAMTGTAVVLRSRRSRTI